MAEVSNICTNQLFRYIVAILIAYNKLYITGFLGSSLNVYFGCSKKRLLKTKVGITNDEISLIWSLQVTLGIVAFLFLILLTLTQQTFAVCLACRIEGPVWVQTMD